MTSRTATVLSSIFQSLEDMENIHVVLNTETKVIDVEMPRLQLAFFFEENGKVIRSRQYRGMIVDGIQSIGALIGLSSKLTLISERSRNERVVLIPIPQGFGNQFIRYTKSNSDHVDVSIDKDSATRVYAYTLDEDLKRISSPGDIQSQLFLCYLFALTSHCLPDPMTERTGTESALEILRSAAVQSFDLLTSKNLELLAEIGRLSPRRSFYPKDKKVMQTVIWNAELPTLSQHADFRSLVENVLEHAARMHSFYPGDGIFNSIADVRRKLSSSAYKFLLDILKELPSFFNESCLDYDANSC